MLETENVTDVLPSGSTIDRYEIQDRLGKGGFASVYRARHLHTRRAVALKVLDDRFRADTDIRERFRREAEVGASIHSDNIVQIFDWACDEDGRSFMAMELCQGESLSELLRKGPIEMHRAVRIAIGLLQGLDAAHRANIVHRDVKPSNVFLVRTKSGLDNVKLLDFGISKHAEPEKLSMTLTGQVLGSPGYMAPEQVNDNLAVDARTDLFSVGIILFEMIAGRRLFTFKSYASYLVQLATTTAPPLASVAPDCPQSLCSLVDQALQPDPSARPKSALSFARALSQLTELPQETVKQLATAEEAPPLNRDAIVTVDLGASSAPTVKNKEVGSQTTVCANDNPEVVEQSRLRSLRWIWIAPIVIVAIFALLLIRGSSNETEGQVIPLDLTASARAETPAPVAEAISYETKSSSAYLSLVITKHSEEQWTLQMKGTDTSHDLHPKAVEGGRVWLDAEETQWLFEPPAGLQFTGPGNPRGYPLPLRQISKR